MLADAPSPHGSDATPKSAGYVVGGSRTVRYLAALPRRVRLMGQTVCLLLTQTITSSSFQVTTRYLSRPPDRADQSPRYEGAGLESGRSAGHYQPFLQRGEG